MKWFHLFLLLTCPILLHAQKEDITIDVRTSADTIYLNNPFKVEFSFNTKDLKFISEPDLSDFDILQGPSTMQSMYIMNGVQTVEFSMSYYLQPKSSGNYAIQSFPVSINGQEYTTPTKTLVILDNPNGIIQDPNTGKIRGGKPIKKKVSRKRYKI